MPNSLSVLHLAHVRWFNAEAQYALDLALEMRRQGHRVCFFTQRGSPGARMSAGAGLDVLEDSGFNRKGLSALAGLASALRLTRTLRAGGYDAVEAHRPEGLPLVAWACRRAGVPLVRVRGDMRPVRGDPLNRLLYGRLLAAVVASNSAIEADVRQRVGPLRHLVTIPGGVDASVFAPVGPAEPVREQLGLPKGSFLVGILGRLGEVKGHDDFLSAARAALAGGAEAAFIVLAKERTPREQELRVTVEADPLLRGRVAFLGHCPDLPAVLRAFDLGVVASTGSEANCRVGLEWMASGVPLLATRVGVLPDLVRDGETGYLVSPRDVGALAARMLRLAADRAEARRLGATARRSVLERFTLARCAEAHVALLRRVRAA